MRAQPLDTGLKKVAVNYLIEHVTKPLSLDWQVLSAETAWALDAKEGKTTFLLIPRLNIGQRTGGGVDWFERVGLQGQLDTYWTISSHFSFFSGYGYSFSGLFPKHQLFGELTYALPKGWGVIGGLKMTHWKHTSMTYMLGAEKYIRNFYLTLRPMLVVADQDVFGALRFTARYYLKDNAFIHSALFYGDSPEYTNFIPDLQELLSLGNWGGYLYWQQPLYKKFALRLGGAWRHEEYKNESWRSVWGVNLGITYNY